MQITILVAQKYQRKMREEFERNGEGIDEGNSEGVERAWQDG